MFLYDESKIESFLEVILYTVGNQYVVYRDSGYALREFLEIPYKGENLAAWQSAFNIAISSVVLPSSGSLKRSSSSRHL